MKLKLISSRKFEFYYKISNSQTGKKSKKRLKKVWNQVQAWQTRACICSEVVTFVRDLSHGVTWWTNISLNHNLIGNIDRIISPWISKMTFWFKNWIFLKSSLILDQKHRLQCCESTSRSLKRSFLSAPNLFQCYSVLAVCSN